MSNNETIPVYAQMTLNEVIDRLVAAEVGAMVIGLTNDADSYRGYYERLAIAPGESVGARLLAGELIGQMGKTMYGYKGGEYPILGDTLVHVAEYGRTGPMLVGFRESPTGNLIPVLVEERW